MSEYSWKYEKTHPWIKFSINLRDVPPKLWLALGEARSKLEHLSGVPLQPYIAERLHEVALARGALATTAIEGNTLSEAEALAVIQKKSVLPKSQEYLAEEINNIVNATDVVFSKIEKDGHTPITVEEIKQYNAMVLKGLSVEEHVISGQFTKTDIGVAGYKAAPWQEAEYLVSELCKWLNGSQFVSGDDDELVTGILKSIIAHIYLVWIHPFGDGNGRTARLLEVRFLTEAGAPSVAVHLLSNHYNKTRTEYYRRLAESSKNGGDITGFLTYAVQGFVDQLRAELKIVKQQQWNVSWRNYVHESFKGKESVSDRRQCRLVLALSARGEIVPRNELRHLTPQTAEDYANKTLKTLTRDVNDLVEMGLISSTKAGVRASNEQILAFLPRLKKGGLQAQILEALRLSKEDEQLGFDF